MFGVLYNRCGGTVGNRPGKGARPAILLGGLALGDNAAGDVALRVPVVLALDVDAGLDRIDRRQGVRPGDDADVIDNPQRCQHLRTQPLGEHRPARAFVDERVGGDRDHEDIAVAARRLEMADMADMEQVESAMRQNDGAALRAQIPGYLGKAVQPQYLSPPLLSLL